MLLHHRRIVVPELFAEATDPGSGTGARGDRAALTALEDDLLARGLLMSAPLWRRMAELPPAMLERAGTGLLEAVDAELGSGVRHVPQFRRFPHSVPADTLELYVQRVFSLLLQEPEQPCVLCGRSGTVHPVSPCAHLVCRICWDGSDYSGCPICHRRIDADDPFLRPAPPADGEPAGVPPGQAGLLALGDADEAARELLTAMLARQTPLPAADLPDVEVLVAHVGRRTGPDGLPDLIPVRETRAVVLATLARHASPETVAVLLKRYAGTATDVLRTLTVLMGGDAGLRERPRRHGRLPRPLRRTLLAHLDGLPFAALAEDMARHAQRWKRMAEALHPFERHRRYPRAALAFALIRRTRLDVATPLGRTLLETAARYPEAVRRDGDRLRLLTHASRVEGALRDGDVPAALELLAARPGEFTRRLVHLLRSAHAQGDPGLPAQVHRVLGAAVPHVSPGVLLAALTQMRIPPGGARMFLPRGGRAQAWTEPDRRPPLPEALRVPAAETIAGELLRRAGRLPGVRHAVLDEALVHLAVPQAERSSSAALLRMPRGSLQPLPDGDRIRLFLHWVEPDGTRVDLDLSLALYDEQWQYLDSCDYTNLRFGGDAAVHSGDLTSAPAPDGSSEFVDLHPKRLREQQVRHVVAVVFSYNDVPFEKLRRGFTGVMRDPGERLFDPAAVMQRFDLSGRAKILVPFVVDVQSRTMRWADLTLSAGGRFHDADGYWYDLARMGSALETVYSAPGRPSLWDVACWHAAARADQVTVRGLDGTLLRYRRGAEEDTAAFAARLTSRTAPDAVQSGPAETDRSAGMAGAGPAGWGTDGADFVAVLHGDLEPAEGAEVFALYPWRLDASRARLLDAADLVSALAPEQAMAAAPARMPVP